MSEIPEALRLAEYMDAPLNDPEDVADAAAAELRRLHAENERLRSDLATLRAENYNTQSLLAGAEAECDALRALLTLMINESEDYVGIGFDRAHESKKLCAAIDAARAALKGAK